MKSNPSRRMALMGVVAFALLGVGLFPHRPANGQEKERSGVLPEGSGLAAKYPSDTGIERDPAVLFAENFETGSIADLGKRWDEVSNKDGKVLAFSSDIPGGSRGTHSLQMTGTLGENWGGHLYRGTVRALGSIHRESGEVVIPARHTFPDA